MNENMKTTPSGYYKLFALLAIIPILIGCGESKQWMKCDQIANTSIEKFQCVVAFAEDGNSAAQYSIAMMYAAGIGVKEDKQQQFDWLLRAADNDHVDAYPVLAELYSNGIGTTKNYNEAEKWYVKAIAKGNYSAEEPLAKMLKKKEFELSKDKNCQRHLDTATNNFMRCFEAANTGDVIAQNDVASFYWNGEGVKADYGKAISWYKKAGEQGSIKAQLKVAEYYASEKYYQYDVVKAMKWYKKAALQGNDHAKAFLEKNTSKQDVH